VGTKYDEGENAGEITMPTVKANVWAIIGAGE